MATPWERWRIRRKLAGLLPPEEELSLIERPFLKRGWWVTTQTALYVIPAHGETMRVEFAEIRSIYVEPSQVGESVRVRFLTATETVVVEHLRLNSAVAKQLQQIVAPPPTAVNGAPRSLSVLVADDDPALRRSISAILEGVGHRVVEAEDGQVALGLLQGQAFDVLVLDLHMPKADGMALLRQIEVPPPVVIICSAFAYVPADAVRDEVGAKVFRYMKKPVPPLELIAVVNEAAAELDR